MSDPSFQQKRKTKNNQKKRNSSFQTTYSKKNFSPKLTFYHTIFFLAIPSQGITLKCVIIYFQIYAFSREMYFQI